MQHQHDWHSAPRPADRDRTASGKRGAGESRRDLRSAPLAPGATAAPEPAKPGNWSFLTEPEAATLGAIADRIIPPDPQTLGGKDAGCVVFVDRQLAGAYGKREGLYVDGPFEHGTKEQGPQSPQTPSELYRAGLAALDKYCRAGTSPDHGQAFVALTAARQDEVLHGIESGSVRLEGIDGKTFFEQLLKDIQQGFFADPIYGGNHVTPRLDEGSGLMASGSIRRCRISTTSR